MKWLLAVAILVAVVSAAAPIPEQKKAAADWECPVCKYAVKYAQLLLETGNTTAEIEAAVHKECMTVFGTIAPYVCDLLDNEVENIIQFLKGGDLPEIVCNKIGLCKDTSKVSLDWECPICKYAVQYAQALLESGNTTAEIEAAVHKECMAVFGTIAPFVCDMIDNEVANIIQYLERGEIPDVVCHLIGLCKDTSKVYLDWECPICKYAVKYVQSLLESGNTTAEIEAAVHKECMAVFGSIAPFVCDMIDNEVANIIQYLESGEIPDVVCQMIGLCKDSMKAIDWECPVCKYAVKYAQELLKKGSTVDEVKAAVHNECVKVFGAVSSIVCGLVDQQLDKIIIYIESDQIPEVVCQKVGLCKSVAPSLDWQCPTCKFAVEYAQALLKSGNTTAEIELAVHNACMKVFEKIEPFVCAIVDGEVENILKLIQGDQIPDVICRKIGLCTEAQNKCQYKIVCKDILDPSTCTFELVC